MWRTPNPQQTPWQWFPQLATARSDTKPQKAPTPCSPISPLVVLVLNRMRHQVGLYAKLSSQALPHLLLPKVLTDLRPRKKRLAPGRVVQWTTVHRQQQLIHGTDTIQWTHSCHAALEHHVSGRLSTPSGSVTCRCTDCAGRQRTSKNDRASWMYCSTTVQLDYVQTTLTVRSRATMMFLLTQTHRSCTIRKNMRCSISIREQRMSEVQQCVSGEYDGVRRNVCASGDSRAPPFPQALRTGAERPVLQKGFRPHVGASGEDGPCPCASCR